VLTIRLLNLLQPRITIITTLTTATNEKPAKASQRVCRATGPEHNCISV
jgi:hypothetical protein